MKRLMLLLLSMGWGYLVFGMAHSLSYEHATGYAPLRQTLPWTIAITLPMVIGALVIHAKAGWAQKVRQMCAGLLIAEAAFFLFLSYIKILAFPPILGFLLLRNPDRPARITPRPEMTKPWLRRNAGALVGLGLLVLFVTWQAWRWFNNPLPSDEEIMEHFKEHKSELEQLVQGYRHFRKSGTGYEKSEEVRTLMQRTSVYHVVGAQGDAGFWYPDHYSTKTIQILKGLYWGRSIHHHVAREDVLATLKREMPRLFEGAPLVRTYSNDDTRLIQVIHVSLGTLRQPHEKCPWYYFGTCIDKGYYHFPQPPRIENGRVLIHEFRNPNGLGPGQRVLESLDDYPPDWKRGECVLKRIDAFWFITMCRTY